jgi:hypothetical protein
VLPTAATDEFAAAVAALPAGLTTTVAHTLLSQAAERRFPEPLAAFVGALGDPAVDRESLARLLERLVATGAHSGADWLAGVVALARACVGACPSNREHAPTSADFVGGKAKSKRNSARSAVTRSP